MLAKIIHRGIGGITGGVDGVLAEYFQVAVDVQAAKGVALAIDLLRQR